MFRAVTPPIIRSSRTVHTASDVPGLLAATTSVVEFRLSWNSTTLVVAASKPVTYQMLYVQFLSS